MNCIIPFTKDIKFNTNISEIVSISLEHEYTANPEEILGNFIITGEYKTHEVSVNKERFEHVVPFSVNLTTKIDPDTVDFAIEDFTYELIDKDTLKVNIEYSINALEVREEEIFEPVEEERETFDEILDSIDEELEQRKEDEVLEDPVIESVEPEEIEETREDNEMNTLVEESITNEEKTIGEEEQTAILETVNPAEETFVTYHIHVMTETDTIESVCIKYNTTQNLLGEYNDLSTVAIGDKIIIPDINE